MLRRSHVTRRAVRSLCGCDSGTTEVLGGSWWFPYDFRRPSSMGGLRLTRRCSALRRATGRGRLFRVSVVRRTAGRSADRLYGRSRGTRAGRRVRCSGGRASLRRVTVVRRAARRLADGSHRRTSRWRTGSRRERGVVCRPLLRMTVIGRTARRFTDGLRRTRLCPCASVVCGRRRAVLPLRRLVPG
jgi:hypothetical protein